MLAVMILDEAVGITQNDVLGLSSGRRAYEYSNITSIRLSKRCLR